MCACAVVKFNTFWYHANTIKELMEEIRYDWSTKRAEIFQIIQNRAGSAKHYATMYASFIYPSACIVTICHLASFILNTKAAENGTRINYFPIMTEYLIDQDKYLYLIVLHQNLSLFICASIFVATETLFIMWMHHAASLFEVASYHIEEAVTYGSALPTISQDHTDNTSKMCLRDAVLAHEKASKFVREMNMRLDASYTFILVFGTISLSVNFFRLSRAICLTHDLEELAISLLFSITELGYMFYLNYVVQLMLDYANRLVTVIYNTNWYRTSIYIQKLLLIIMIKCTEPVSYPIFGFYFASIEGFATLVRNTMSYFMMMTSIEV
ncbi:uncharacterized protein LOC128876571 isoform X1 [Hylaeus volcanicus]|nr:uncharacterized protein LOC128876571 isoform X1 [Hylaeus volcanicus]